MKYRTRRAPRHPSSGGVARRVKKGGAPAAGGWRAAPVAAAVLLALLAAAPAPAGRGHFERRAERKGWDYPKITGYTYIEDGKDYGRLTLAANVELAMFRLDDPFLPILFALASERRPPVNLSPERFRLVLPDGRVLEPVSYHRLMEEGYRAELVHDWARRRGVNVTHGYFTAGYRLTRTQFYPDPAGRGGVAVRMEDVELVGDQYAVDAVYFPNPGGLADQELRLVYEDPASGADGDVLRRIEVPLVIPDPHDGGGEERKPSSRRSGGGGE